MARGEPMLMESGLSRRVYLVTSYKDLGEGRYEALTKYDVTEQFNAILAARTGGVREEATE